MIGFIPAGDPRFESRYRECRYSAFRFEGLQVYRGSGEDDWIRAFEQGLPAPPHDPAQDDWEAVIRGHRAAGRVMQRVHTVLEPLSAYLRFELTWAYAPNAAAGEDIRVIPIGAGERWPPDLPRRDFHLFDNSELYDAHYSEDGTWLGVEAVGDPTRIVRACRWRDALLHRGVPWAEFIASRPDLAARLPTPVG